jgi:threonine synthase
MANLIVLQEGMGATMSYRYPAVTLVLRDARSQMDRCRGNAPLAKYMLRISWASGNLAAAAAAAAAAAGGGRRGRSNGI